MSFFEYVNVPRIFRSFRAILLGLANLWLGLFGLSLFFENFAPGESPSRRIILIAIFYLVSSLLTGFLEPRYWKLAISSSWGAVTVGITSFIYNWGQWDSLLHSLLFFAPLPLTILGGFLGARMHGIKNKNLLV